MAGYLGTKAVFLSTTAASVTGNAEITGDLTVDTNTLHVDSTNNRVGVGTSSPSEKLSVELASNSGSTLFYGGTQPERGFKITAGNEGGFDNSAWTMNASADNSGSMLVFKTRNAEAMRIDASGNLVVAKTTIDADQYGAELRASGVPLVATAINNNAAYFNRKSSDGTVVNIAKDGTTVGSIRSASGNSIEYNCNGGILYLARDASNGVEVLNSQASATPRLRPSADNAVDLGDTGRRFDDIYATNGTIQTSDANEKQQIASLTDAEMQAAKAISALFKTFKWNDKVAEKGDAARKHTGVIAQDVQQAMADADLDAGDYAFFISNTWWETQTEVPAVEAVEAQDAVYDEEGNLISEAVDAVEAQEAYTRTDTYDTLEEAPEGATERTRLGIRYPELLAFIGAATEQRLASIEARLDALEGV